MDMKEKGVLASLIWHPEIRFYIRHIDKRFLSQEARTILDTIADNETAPADDIVVILGQKGVNDFDFLDAGTTVATAKKIITEFVNEHKRHLVSNKLITTGERLHNKLIDLEEAFEEVRNYQQLTVLESPIFDAKQIAKEEEEMLNKVWSGELETIEWPYKSLEKICNGLWGEELCIIAGRPGMGKTTFMLNTLERWAKQGRRVGFISLEMKARSLVLKACQKEFPAVNLHQAVSTLSGEDRKKLISSVRNFAKLPIYFADSGQSDLATVLTTIQNLKYSYGTEIVAIDYLQLIRGQKRHQNRDQEVGEISRALKQMAMRLNMPIIVGAQLNRETEKQDGGKPMLRNLRESGNIEQDADLIMFLYRPYYYTKNEYEENNLVAMIRKQRNGAIGNVTLNYYLNTQEILDSFN